VRIAQAAAAPIRLRSIYPRELPEKPKGGSVVSLGGFFLRAKATQMLVCAINTNSDTPLAPTLAPGYSLKPEVLSEGRFEFRLFWTRVASRRLLRLQFRPSLSI
jgi:hypothetical protein